MVKIGPPRVRAPEVCLYVLATVIDYNMDYWDYFVLDVVKNIYYTK